MRQQFILQTVTCSDVYPERYVNINPLNVMAIETYPYAKRIEFTFESCLHVYFT